MYLKERPKLSPKLEDANNKQRLNVHSLLVILGDSLRLTEPLEPCQVLLMEPPRLSLQLLSRQPPNHHYPNKKEARVKNIKPNRAIRRKEDELFVSVGMVVKDVEQGVEVHLGVDRLVLETDERLLGVVQRGLVWVFGHVVSWPFGGKTSVFLFFFVESS